MILRLTTRSTARSSNRSTNPRSHHDRHSPVTRDISRTTQQRARFVNNPYSKTSERFSRDSQRHACGYSSARLPKTHRSFHEQFGCSLHELFLNQPETRGACVLLSSSTHRRSIRLKRTIALRHYATRPTPQDVQARRGDRARRESLHPREQGRLFRRMPCVESYKRRKNSQERTMPA